MMSFESTRLADTPVIRAAYARFAKSVEADKKEDLTAARQKIEKQTAYQMMRIKEDPKYTPAQKENLYKQIFMLKQKKIAEQNELIQERYKTRWIDVTGTAASFFLLKTPYDENAAAACLLLPTMQTPMDYKDIEKKFGAEIADTLSEVRQATSYPDRADSIVPGFKPESKLFILLEAAKLLRLKKMSLDRTAPGKKLFIAMSDIEKTFESVRPLLGICKKADRLYTEAFNTYYNDTFKSGVTIRMEDGRPVLDKKNGDREIFVFTARSKELPDIQFQIDPKGNIIGGKPAY